MVNTTNFQDAFHRNDCVLPQTAVRFYIQSFFSFSAAEDRKLFIGGLSWETREPQLKEYFEKFGEVESVNLKMNPMTGKSRCFAFVVFKTAADVVSVHK